VLSAIIATSAARAAFYVLLNAFIAYQYEAETGFAPAQMQGLVTLAILITLIRPFLGMINDAHPIGKYRRKNFMLLGNALYVASITMLMMLPNPATLGGLLGLASAFLVYGAAEAILDVGTDSLCLDLAAMQSEKNRIKAMARVGAIGGLIIAYAAGALLVGIYWVWFLIAIAAMIIVGTILTARINEPPITREQVVQQVRAERLTIPASYKQTLLIMGILMLLTALGEGLVNVQLEPYLIGRYGNEATQFYFTEVSGAVIAFGAVAGIAASRRAMSGNLSRLIIPSAIAIIAFYTCLPWLAPDLFAYFVWVTIKGTGAMLFTLAVDRLLMDVVKGARKGSTYQIFTWFTTGGGVIGTSVGAVLGAVMPFEALLVLVGIVDAAALVMYLLVLVGIVDAAALVMYLLVLGPRLTRELRT